MRIDGSLPILRQTLTAALTGAAATDAAFRIATDTAAAGPPPQVTAMPTAVTSMQMLVALAAVDPGVEQRRRVAVQTDRGLTLLERLRDAMAAGRASAAQIAEMHAWASDFAVPDDPVLGPIARDVELRVRVELARHDVRA